MPGRREGKGASFIGPVCQQGPPAGRCSRPTRPTAGHLTCAAPDTAIEDDGGRRRLRAVSTVRCPLDVRERRSRTEPSKRDPRDGFLAKVPRQNSTDDDGGRRRRRRTFKLSPFSAKKIRDSLVLGIVSSRLTVWSGFVSDMAGGPKWVGTFFGLVQGQSRDTSLRRTQVRTP